MVNDENACADEAVASRRKLTKKDFERVNIGQAFWQSRTDRIQDKDVRALIMRYRKTVESMIRSGSGLIFMGPPGTGKTSAAVCIVKEAIGANLSVYFTPYSELRDMRDFRSDKAKELFGDGTDGITVARKVATTSLLVIDGIHDNFFTDKIFGPLQLEELVAQRVAHKLTTIITTRCEATFRREEYSDLFDLISSCMVPVRMDGKNLREETRKKLVTRVLGRR